MYSRPASSTLAALLYLPPACVEEGAGVEEACVEDIFYTGNRLDEVRQPVASGQGRF